MSSPVVSRHRVVDRAPQVEPALSPPPPVTRITGRYRFDRRTGAWWWSPEMFALHGLPPGSAAAGHRGVPRSTSTRRTAHGSSTPSPRACTTGRDFALETRIIRADGQERDVVLVGEAQLDGAGWSPPSRACAIDITECRPPGSPTERAQALQAEVGQLRAAMASRAAIEQAKGILMLLTSCGDQVAFDLLAHISSHTHRKVRDVAVVITESAAGRGPAARRRPRDHPGRLPADTARSGSAVATAGSSRSRVVRDNAGATRRRVRRRGHRRAPRRGSAAWSTSSPGSSCDRCSCSCSDRTSPAGRTCRPPAPFIIASNHLSFIDSMAIPLMSPAAGRLPGQGRVLHRPRHRRVADQDAVHRARRAARASGRPTGPRRRRSTPR